MYDIPLPLRNNVHAVIKGKKKISCFKSKTNEKMSDHLPGFSFWIQHDYTYKLRQSALSCLQFELLLTLLHIKFKDFLKNMCLFHLRICYNSRITEF